MTSKEKVQYLNSKLIVPTYQINVDFRIKVNRKKRAGGYLSGYVGVSGLVDIIGLDMTNKFLSRVYSQGVKGNVYLCKLRSGIVVRFYLK